MNLGARRSRILGVIWILAGLSLLGGALVLWLDRRTMSVWEVPLAVVAIGVGLYLWSQRVTVDRYGLTLSSLMGSQRILWAGIASVDMQATWWRPSMTIHRKGDGQTTPIRTTSGLTARQRDQLYDLLLELSREHGFVVRRPGLPDPAPVAAAPVADDPGTADEPDDAATNDGPVTNEPADAGDPDSAAGEDAGADEARESPDPDATIPLDPIVVSFDAGEDDVTEEVVVDDGLDAPAPDRTSTSPDATAPAPDAIVELASGGTDSGSDPTVVPVPEDQAD